MGLHRPSGATGVAGAASSLYTLATGNYTITGNWNFTGTFTINGNPPDSLVKYSLEGNTGSIAQNATVSVDITHGLGTDNVMVYVMLKSTQEEMSYQWRRPDGHLRGGSYGVSFHSGTAATTPASGQVNLRITNTGVDADTIYYSVLVRSMD